MTSVRDAVCFCPPSRTALTRPEIEKETLMVKSTSQLPKSPSRGDALLRLAAAAVYLGTILWVLLHPASRGGDLVNFKDNAACAVPVAVCMALAVGLYLLASKTSAYEGTLRWGCGSSLIGWAAAIIAAFTLVPESWSQQEFGHVFGNALWVTGMPGVAVFAIGLRIRLARARKRKQ